MQCEKGCQCDKCDFTIYAENLYNNRLNITKKY